MASTSKVQSDGPPAVHSPQLQQSTDEATNAVVADADHGEGETVLEPLNLPDICKPEWQREGMPDTEFNRKYPPDAWGEEAAPTARVWKVYCDQQTPSDRTMLDTWNKTLDVLLIFAGLFSAVSTAFLIEAYKALQPDYTQYIAAFLYAAAVSHNHSGTGFPAMESIISPDQFIRTSPTQRWTNGLWFSSLVISLVVALLCILVKQWLDEYESHVSSAPPSPIYWARRHRMYYRGLTTWGVPGLISFLPLLLHVSLFLFFGGLVLFLLPLDGAISYSIVAMVSCIGAFYVLSLVLPAWYVECPSYTPLLAQGLQALFRVISGILYVIRPLKRPTYLSTHGVLDALSALTERAEQWLKSIQLRARHLRAREARAISERYQELDGYALSALIHVPNDTDQDVVNSACAAIGAVTSVRTIQIIASKVAMDDLTDIINDCYEYITLANTGYVITAHAQLRRAHQVMWFRNTPSWSATRAPAYAPGLRSSLGIDGLLIQALGVEDADGRQFDIDVLVHQLQSLPLDGDTSCGYPLRSTCLVFLEIFTQYPRPDRQFLSCVFLVFSAGCFARSNLHELVRALRSVESVLRTQCAIDLPVHNNGDEEYVCAAINGVWMMLAEFRRYNIDTLTAQTVAHQALRCVAALPSSKQGLVWAQHSGLSTFVRSTTFGQCVDTADGLAEYISRLWWWTIVDRAKVPLEDYWVCIATLLRMSWNSSPRSQYAGYFLTCGNLFRLSPDDWGRAEYLSKGGPYSSEFDWQDPILSAVLDSPNAISTWAGASSIDLGDDCIRALASLASRISIVLCRRKRLGLADDSFIRGLFSGSFLFARFRDLASRHRIPGPEWLECLDNIALKLSRHCLKLSSAGVLEICAQLEEMGDADSELRSRAVAFAQSIRDLSVPGGEPGGECAADCPCMFDGDHGTRSLGGVWTYGLSRFQHRCAEAATDEAV